MEEEQAISPEEELHLLLKQEADYLESNKFYEMYPDEGPFSRAHYPRQMECFAFGREYTQRCFMGGNGTGKTWGVAAYELTCHLTGDYPVWWNGRVFTTPINAWVAGDTRETVRDIIQAKLLGDVAKLGDGALGTGMIPRHCFAGAPKYIANTNKAADHVLIKHKSGGNSVLGFRAYEQGRKAFQGTEQHIIVLDEEPPKAVYDECMQRTRVVEGMILTTFTPLSGHTEVVEQFLNWRSENAKGAKMMLVRCGWDDVPHLDEEWKRSTEAGMLAYQREARKLGIPAVGVGKIYPVEESAFVIRPIAIPPHWRRVYGFDGGWHNTAAVWMAYDKDEDVVYIYSEYKRGEVTVDVHAAAIKARGEWIPGVGDAAAREGHSNDTVLSLYRARGLKLQLADKSIDAGIQDVLSRLEVGKLKVFSTCVKWLDEYRTYAYDDKQKVVKRNDHLMDATRFGVRSGLKIAAFERAPQIYMPEIKFG